MNEKVKKYLIVTAYQAVLSAVLLLILLMLGEFAPEIMNRISAVWTKNTNLSKLGTLLLSAFKELVPF